MTRATLNRRWLRGAATALLCFSAASACAGDRLFYRMGGETKLKAAVDELVTVILKDERINFAFAETDLPKFKHQLYSQLCELAAGPCIYDGRDMRTAHEKLPLTNAHFNALTEDLYIALDRVGVSYPLQNELIALLAPMQRDVVRK